MTNSCCWGSGVLGWAVAAEYKTPAYRMAATAMERRINERMADPWVWDGFLGTAYRDCSICWEESPREARWLDVQPLKASITWRLPDAKESNAVGNLPRAFDVVVDR